MKIHQQQYGRTRFNWNGNEARFWQYENADLKFDGRKKLSREVRAYEAGFTDKTEVLESLKT